MDLGKVRWYVEEQMKDLPRLVHEKTDEGLHSGLCYFESNNIHLQFLYNLDYKHFRETTLRWILLRLSQYRFGRYADTGRN